MTRDDTTDDAFLGGRLAVLQPRTGYRAGLDAVLLAATVHAPADGRPLRVVDAGAGVGVVGLCVACRIASAHVILAEREPGLVALARANITRNALGGRVTAVAFDVTARRGTHDDADNRDEIALIAPESADVVLANPPFTGEGEGTPSPHRLKAAAHQMPAAALDQWVRFMAHVAVPGGVATMIHRADAIAEILHGFAGRFGALQVLPIHPRTGESATRVIVSGVKGSRAPTTLLAGLVLHGDGREFRPAIEAILRDGAALDVGLRS